MGKQWKQWQSLFFGFQNHCRYEIKRCLLLGRKTMTNLDSILKSRKITLPTKVHLVKAMIFPVVMYGCESWTIKTAEHQRIDAFELWCSQTYVHWVGDAIQPSHPQLSLSPPALNLSQHQGLFKWVSSLHQVAKGLEFQLQHQFFQWTPRTDLL